MDEKLTGKLVFLDLTHPKLIVWEKQQFSSFLAIIRELTIATQFVIVSVMEFGHQLVNFTSALKDMKDARVLLECGAYKGDITKREAKHDDKLTKIKMKAPRWEFVGMETFNDQAFVRPLSKRAGFCSPLLGNANFSAEGNTILDFFALEALLMARDIIFFADSEPEAEFVGKFSKELVRYSERVKKWFFRYKAAKTSASTSQPASLSHPVSTSQAALTRQPSSSSHPTEQSKDDQLADGEDPPSPFVLDDLLMTDALERLCNVRKAGLDFGDTI
ncbi:hypothetical protein R1sor_009065 [Riccia sorocarpa]|uniref:Uncharacterized protein n=1 Tax=Riccia sorocarpa TaxID=122646 RepID=A0ABD3H6P6_9MARC